MPPKKTAPATINKSWFFVVEIIGLGLSLYLYLVSTGMVPTPPCARNSIFACSSILRGDYSHFGPFSVAAMGGVYYLCHLMLTVGLREKLAQSFKALLVFSGLIFVAWLRSIELIYEHKICPWCWGVALVTLIHAGLTYALVSPPMPRLKPAGIFGAIFGGFIVLIGLTSLVELGLSPAKKLKSKPVMLAASDEDDSDAPPIATPDSPAKSTPTPKPTPKATPKPTATPKATPTVTPAISVSDPVPPTPLPSPIPTATPSPTPAAKAGFDPEPQLEDSEDVRVLRKRGWRHAGSGESVIKAIKAQPPVLVLIYDPHCTDCHHLITKVLDSDLMNGVRVTRIAIQESMLTGQLNEWVKAMPTLFLFDSDGTRLMEYVGSRISDKELVKMINDGLAKAKH